MRANPMKFADYKTAIIELKGGINENVSSLELGGGELIDCRNYMIAEGGYGGYRSIKGYERMDGSILPSTFLSVVLKIIDAPLGITEGQLITGGTTGATVTALEDGVPISGSFIDGDAIVFIECLIATSTLVKPELLSTVSGAVGTLDNVLNLEGGTSDYNKAIQFASDNVEEVPGELNILGLNIFDKKIYAFRKKVGVNEIGLYVESAVPADLGWLEIDTSADPIVYDGPTSHNFKFTNYNFYASDVSGPGYTLTYSMYWVDTFNQARVYDGSNPVVTIDNPGMSAQGIDAPINIVAHNFHLFLAYPNGSLQHSVLGDPTNFTGVVGAREIGLGDEITNLVSGVESSLLIFLEEGIYILLGNTIDDFVLDTFSTQSGAFTKSAQRLLGTVFFLDDRGLSNVQAVQEFGDYGANSISQKFKSTLLKTKHLLNTTVTSRNLNQYRMFFSDRTGIYVSFEGKELQGATFVEYPIVVNISAQGEDDEKNDLIIFSTNDDQGFIYKMDSGNTFDGSIISCRLTTAFYHYGTPRQWKAFKRATFEVSAEDTQEFYMKVEFNYNELGNPNTIWHTPTVYREDGTAVWGAGSWGTMVYGVGETVTNRVPLYLQGIGTNMSYKVISNENYREPHIIQNIITDLEPVGRRV